MDNHLFRSFGEIDRLQSEILHLQLELSVSEDFHAANVDRLQGEATQRDGEMVQLRVELVQLRVELAQLQRELTQRQRDIASRDTELAARDVSIRILEDQLLSAGIAPVTRASSSSHGQTSSPPSPDPVSRDWFFDDPPSS